MHYAIVYGEVGDAWSEFADNGGLPDPIKALIDTKDFQESWLRGLEQLAARDTVSLEELQERYGRG